MWDGFSYLWMEGWLEMARILQLRWWKGGEGNRQQRMRQREQMIGLGGRMWQVVIGWRGKWAGGDYGKWEIYTGGGPEFETVFQLLEVWHHGRFLRRTQDVSSCVCVEQNRRFKPKTQSSPDHDQVVCVPKPKETSSADSEQNKRKCEVVPKALRCHVSLPDVCE